MSFSRELLERIKERSRISDLASQYTEVKPSGRNLVGLSPFQDEKTASFYIYDDDTRFKCFSSGKGGSAFDFVMETRGLSFPEAVTYLAEKAGIELPKQSNQSRKKVDQTKKLYEMLSLVTEIFHQNLLDRDASRSAQDYLKKRGIDSGIAKQFGIGYAPERWQYIAEAVEARLEKTPKAFSFSKAEVEAILKRLGLIKEKEASKQKGSKYYDSFRDRVLFPIYHQEGKPIAFGGRLMSEDSQAPKYINSSESPIYEKRRVLYGYARALASIRKMRKAILVEGYFDVVSLHKKGVTEAVATCGTSLTPDHASLLSRVATHVTTVFDGDRAGRKAAGRCFESFLNSGCEVGVVFLDDGEDPDSLAQKLSEEELRKLFIERERPALEVFLEQSYEDLSGESFVPGESFQSVEPAIRGKLAKLLARHLSKILNPVEKDAFISLAAKKLSVSEESISELLQSKALSRPASKRKSYESAPSKQTGPRTKRSNRVALQSAEQGQSVQQSMRAYVRQIVVSVLCEPTIAEAILSNPALTEKGELPQALPKEVIHLLRSFSSSDFGGLAIDLEASSLDETNKAKSILEKHKFRPERFIEEAKSQLVVGGSSHKEMAESFGLTNERFQKNYELKQLREGESKVTDPSERERMAQEKLLKKRSLKNK